MPALIRPADFPEDAEGRVAFISVTLTDAEEAPNGIPPAQPDPAPDHPSPWSQLSTQWGGWGAVGVLGLALLVAFIVGMLVTR